MKKTLARMLAGAVIVGLAAVPGCAEAAKPKKAVAPQSAKLYLSPKIDQAGDTPSSVGNAAAAGSAQMLPADTTRTMTIQHRAAGSSDPWVALKSGKPASNGYMTFRGWSTDEYRVVLAANSTYPTYTSDPLGYTWKTVFTDEFNGTDLSDTWSLRGTKYTDGMTHAKADASACTVSGGVLSLKTIADPDNPGNYLNCHVGTQDAFDFTHGWAAARVKFQRYAGSHSGFWLQSSPSYVPGSAEVDVAEDFGSDANIFNTVYWDWTDDGVSNLSKDQVATSETEAVLPTGDHWWDSYHVVSVRWTSTQYQYWIDDTKVYTTSQGISENPEYLVLSMLTRDFEAPKMREDLASYHTDVDWVRVWQ